MVSFKGAHFPKEIILTAIPYHCRVIEEFGGVTISSAKEETMRHSYRPDSPPTPQSYRTQVLKLRAKRPAGGLKPPIGKSTG